MNVAVTDKKKKLVPAIIAATLVILFLCTIMGFVLYAAIEDKTPIGILIVIGGIIFVLILSILYVLVQRISEIRKGEQNEASKY